VLTDARLMAGCVKSVLANAPYSPLSVAETLNPLPSDVPLRHRPRTVKYANIDSHHSAQIVVLFTADVTEKLQGGKRFRWPVSQLAFVY